jgi:hypothetical protein
MELQVSGLVSLVTGGSKGIGLATTLTTGRLVDPQEVADAGWLKAV